MPGERFVLSSSHITIGPLVAEGGGGASRVDIVQLVVPVIASVPENRQPCKLRIVPPAAVIEPSQVVGAVSPTPRMTRYDCDGVDERVAA